MANALEFHSVSKSFNKKGKSIQAVKDVSFSLGEGEVFGFVGPNGAGKSTTIKIMLDIINNYTGEVTIYGTSSRLAHSRRGIAYLPESPALYEQFTPLEILRMSLRMYGIKKDNLERWCLQWLERFSVVHNAHRRIQQLSKGNVQRVALAHAMVTKPRLLVLDEPLSGLDPVGRRDVIDILQEYKNEGGAIFFTSHVLHDVERIADRFGFINNGALVTTRQPKELYIEDASKFIVRYQSQSEALFVGTQLREKEYEYEVSQDTLPQFINQINEHNSSLISITPKTSLESVFFKILQQNNNL